MANQVCPSLSFQAHRHLVQQSVRATGTTSVVWWFLDVRATFQGASRGQLCSNNCTCSLFDRSCRSDFLSHPVTLTTGNPVLPLTMTTCTWQGSHLSMNLSMNSLLTRQGQVGCGHRLPRSRRTASGAARTKQAWGKETCGHYGVIGEEVRFLCLFVFCSCHG